MLCVFGDACPYPWAHEREEKMIMDVETTLATMRELYTNLLHHEGPLVDPVTTGIALAEAVEALDEWISRGGFLPAEWSIMRAR